MCQFNAFSRQNGSFIFHQNRSAQNQKFLLIYLLYRYYNIASIPWYQRKVAAVIFATPPSGTYEEALEKFMHAEEVEPNFYR